MLKKWSIRGSDTLNRNAATQSSCCYHFKVDAAGNVVAELTSKGKVKPWTKDASPEFDYVYQRLVSYRWNERLGKYQPEETYGYGGMVTFHFHPDFFKPAVKQ